MQGVCTPVIFWWIGLGYENLWYRRMCTCRWSCSYSSYEPVPIPIWFLCFPVSDSVILMILFLSTSRDNKLYSSCSSVTKFWVKRGLQVRLGRDLTAPARLRTDVLVQKNPKTILLQLNQDIKPFKPVFWYAVFNQEEDRLITRLTVCIHFTVVLNLPAKNRTECLVIPNSLGLHNDEKPTRHGRVLVLSALLLQLTPKTDLEQCWTPGSRNLTHLWTTNVTRRQMIPHLHAVGDCCNMVTCQMILDLGDPPGVWVRKGDGSCRGSKLYLLFGEMGSREKSFLLLLWPFCPAGEKGWEGEGKQLLCVAPNCLSGLEHGETGKDVIARKLPLHIHVH